MIGTGKINHETKAIILETIYGDDVTIYHYSLLDLLKCQRYLIKRKTNEITNLLKAKNVKIHEELKNNEFFSDVEKKFYEGTLKLIFIGSIIDLKFYTRFLLPNSYVFTRLLLH